MTARQQALNRSNPANARAKTGDVLADLISRVNELTAKHNSTCAKLDADAGVTDVNYVSTQGIVAGTVPLTILSLEQRT